jgi:arylsulfatase A-like enzyme
MSGRARRRARAALIAAGLLLAAAGVAYRVRVRGGAPNVLFILVDTLRADRLHGYGRARELTPFLRQYAAQSIVYDRAYAPSSWTIPSVVSLFVGQRPFEHGVTDFYVRLPDGAVTVADVFSAHGYDTAAFLASTVLAPERYAYGKGFARWTALEPHTTDHIEPADASEISAAALTWLDHRDTRRPFFVYLHYMEPHSPYRPHGGPTSASARTRDRELRDRALNTVHIADAAVRARTWKFSYAEQLRLRVLYDGEVAYLDGCLRDLFAELARRGALRDTIVVITADHGEELGEHRMFGHGVALYEAEIRVPLIIYVPGMRAGHVRRPVETAGLARTLFRIVGIDASTTFRVPPLPLADEIDDDTASERPTISELAPVTTLAVWLHRTAVVEHDHKLLVGADGTVEVHEILVDDEERRPGVPTPADVARAAALDAFDRRVHAEAGPRPADEHVVERLRALGYVGAPATAE